MHAIVTLETPALDKPNKVSVLFTDAAAKRPPTVYLLRKFTSLPFRSNFIRLIYTICNALTLVLHNVNKQKN